MTKALHLLIVDDEEEICDLIADIASDRGFEVTAINEAEKVAAVLAERVPDMVLLDLMMPGTDGVELLRVFADKAKKAKICLMSGHDARVLNSAKRLGTAHGLDVFAIFEKPIDIAVLRATLDQVSAKANGEKPEVVDVSSAITQKQIVVHYQPYVSMTSREIYGFEALTRWNHPTRGLLPPAAFLGNATEDGAMVPLTHYMLESAIEEAGRWHQKGDSVKIGVNVTATTLLDLTLPDRLIKLCELHKLPPGNLILEVTENEAMRDTKRTMDVLLRLRLKDFGVAIDDFGTGHSSLRELQRMPFSEMKIDQSFVMDMAASKDSRVIVNTIIDLGHNLGLKIVAEGVEDAKTWNLLNEKQCDIAQGYLIAKPMAASEVPGWMSGWRTKPTV